MMMKNLLLTLLFSSAAFPSSAADMLVTPAWLKANLNDPKLVLFHVGTKPEYEKEHIPGAQLVVPQDLSIPRAESTLAIQLLPSEALRLKLESLGVSDDSRVVVYFGSDLISPTTRVYFSLDAAGLGDITSVLDGGMPAWKALGGEVTALTPAPRSPGRITAKARPELVASAEDVRSVISTPGVRIIDSRMPEFFSGANPGATPRAGRIPGASNIPFRSLADDSLKMKSEAEVAEIFKAAGVKSGDRVVSYCHTGQQATLVYFAAKRLGIEARMYDGSWDEWSRLTDLPVETSVVKQDPIK
jgi:thiosulfate/3-mercaptopyruvate sulfurtransferase